MGENILFVNATIGFRDIISIPRMAFDSAEARAYHNDKISVKNHDTKDCGNENGTHVH